MPSSGAVPALDLVFLGWMCLCMCVCVCVCVHAAASAVAFTRPRSLPSAPTPCSCRPSQTCRTLSSTPAAAMRSSMARWAGLLRVGSPQGLGEAEQAALKRAPCPCTPSLSQTHTPARPKILTARPPSPAPPAAPARPRLLPQSGGAAGRAALPVLGNRRRTGGRGGGGSSRHAGRLGGGSGWRVAAAALRPACLASLRWLLTITTVPPAQLLCRHARRGGALHAAKGRQAERAVPGGAARRGRGLRLPAALPARLPARAIWAAALCRRACFGAAGVGAVYLPKVCQGHRGALQRGTCCRMAVPVIFGPRRSSLFSPRPVPPPLAPPRPSPYLAPPPRPPADRIGETIPMHPAICIRGTVVTGFGRGSRQLGIPTANIDADSLRGALAEAVTGGRRRDVRSECPRGLKEGRPEVADGLLRGEREAAVHACTACSSRSLLTPRVLSPAPPLPGIFGGFASVGDSPAVYKTALSLGWNPVFGNAVRGEARFEGTPTSSSQRAPLPPPPPPPPPHTHTRPLLCRRRRASPGCCTTSEGPISWGRCVRSGMSAWGVTWVRGWSVGVVFGACAARRCQLPVHSFRRRACNSARHRVWSLPLAGDPPHHLRLHSTRGAPPGAATQTGVCRAVEGTARASVVHACAQGLHGARCNPRPPPALYP